MSEFPVPAPARPPTPQVLLHRLPDRQDALDASKKPSKYIILLMASTGFVGKAQIAKTVATDLACPEFPGDSLHLSCAKAATVGAGRRVPSQASADEDASGLEPGVNESRYQRMWLSRMTRTGLLFPKESRPATGGFSGFGGTSSTSTSRRGSASSIDSVASSTGDSTTSSIIKSTLTSGPPTALYVNKPVITKQRPENETPALLVLTHPPLEAWHRLAIRNAVGDYGIGVIFVPLEDDGEMPVLKPLDPRTMTSFGSFQSSSELPRTQTGLLGEELTLDVDFDAKVEDIAKEVIDGTRAMMGLVTTDPEIEIT